MRSSRWCGVHLTPSEKSSLWSRLCRSHRSQLTSQCFQQDHLQLTPAILDSLLTSPYLARLLSHCLSLTIRLSYIEAEAANFSQQLIQLFNPLPPQPEPDPATSPPPSPPPFPFPHLTHLSLHEDSDTGVVPVILSHPSFPRSLRQLHVLYRSYQHPLPPFVVSTFPALAELSLPATLSTSNVRAILRLPALRVLDLSLANVVSGQGGDDEDDVEGGWVSAVRATGGVGQQLEVLVMPRSGGQIDDVLKLMHSQVKMEPVAEGEVDEMTGKDDLKDGAEQKLAKDDTSTDQDAGEKKDSFDVELIRREAEIKLPSSEKEEKKERHVEQKEEIATATEVQDDDTVKMAADVDNKADEKTEAEAETVAEATEEPIPDAPPLDAGAVFFPARFDLFGVLRRPPLPPVGRYPELEEKQKAEETLAEQLKRAATPPPSATGRRKKPIAIPSNIRYLSISGQLTVAGVHSLSKLPQLHALMFDFYQMSSVGDVFEAFLECAKDKFTQMRVLRLCDWSDDQMGNRRQRRETRLRVTERMKLMFTRLQQLEYLDMRFPPVCDVSACLPALYQMRNLRKLWLINTQSVRGELQDDDECVEGQWRDEWTVGPIAAFPHLVELNISSLGVDEESILSIIANAPQLLDMSLLYSAEVSFASLFALSRHCPKLRFLDVDGCVDLALTAEGWELGHDKYTQWLAKQPNLATAASSQLVSSMSLSSASPSPPLPFVSTTLTFPSLQFLYTTLSFDTDADFMNLDTDGLTRFVDALSSSPITHANISSEHLTSKHVALFERWTALVSLNLATTGYGSQPRMAKTMLDYGGKVPEADEQAERDDDDEIDEDDDEEHDDEQEDEGKEDDEKASGKEEQAVEPKMQRLSIVQDEQFPAHMQEVSQTLMQQGTNGKEEADNKAKRKLKKKRRKDKAAADSNDRKLQSRAEDELNSKEEKKEPLAHSSARTVASLQTLSSSSSSPSSSLSLLGEPDVDNLHIYTRPAKRTPLEQSAHDRSITTHSHLHTDPRTELDLHMLRYEGADGDETTTLVFGRTFREDAVHDGLAGREAYFDDLRRHLVRDRKRSESELWNVRGRGRGRRRRHRGHRGGFGFGGR